jgi:hypothetical protein
MRTVLISLAVVTAVGLSCSRVGYKKQNECRTTEDNDNLVITCQDNIIRIPKVKGPKGDRGTLGPRGYPGENGTNGVNGQDGADGKSCSVSSTTTGAIISCEDGTSAVINNGVDGTNGVDGQDGAAGQDGQDGVNGTNGANGQDGANGVDGADGQDSIIEVINPCGVEGGFEEVLFRLSNGKVYAVYFSGSLSFLTELTPGNYQTTDGHSCSFTVNTDLTVTW